MAAIAAAAAAAAAGLDGHQSRARAACGTSADSDTDADMDADTDTRTGARRLGAPDCGRAWPAASRPAERASRVSAPDGKPRFAFTWEPVERARAGAHLPPRPAAAPAGRCGCGQGDVLNHPAGAEGCARSSRVWPTTLAVAVAAGRRRLAGGRK